MKNFIKVKFISLLTLLILSCGTESDFPTRYVIENATDRRVEIKFYDHNSKVDGSPLLVSTRTILGEGIVYNEARTVQGPADSDSPLEIFEADSIVLIFDRKKKEAHLDGIPAGNSLSFIGDYIGKGKTNYRYIITEENYENAEFCEGECE